MSKRFKTLIFDLGDVIIDIDYLVTIGEFQKLAKVDFSHLVSYNKQHHLFDKFETGHITAQQFRDELKQYLKDETSDEDINRAWNSILFGYPEQKIRLLQQLKPRYHTLALSNINEIHLASINEAARSKFGLEHFESLFHKAYYSNLVGYRKPDKEIYELVLKMENINPTETFFVDDKAENVEAAKTLGLNAYQLKERDKLIDLLQRLEII
jgi:putative hydrolase of the HAD superfamily